MWKKILVAYDGSTNSDRALSKALELTRLLHAELKTLTVVEYPEGIELAEQDYLNATAQEYNDAFAAVLGATVALTQPPVLELKVGEPVDIMLHYIAQNTIDLLVIGTSHKSLLDKFMLGSVSTAVLKRAPCSVLLVRD